MNVNLPLEVIEHLRGVGNEQFSLFKQVVSIKERLVVASNDAPHIHYKASLNLGTVILWAMTQTDNVFASRFSDRLVWKRMTIQHFLDNYHIPESPGELYSALPVVDNRCVTVYVVGEVMQVRFTNILNNISSVYLPYHPSIVSVFQDIPDKIKEANLAYQLSGVNSHTIRMETSIGLFKLTVRNKTVNSLPPGKKNMFLRWNIREYKLATRLDMPVEVEYTDNTHLIGSV